MKAASKIAWYILAIAPIVLLIIGYVFPAHFFESQESIRDFISQFGVLGPLAFIGLQILQVVITPLSHYTVSLAGGFVFGIWPGFLYNWLGRVIGTALAFYIARVWGRQIIKHIARPETLHKYDFYFEKGRALIFLAYFLPFFPDDEISYLAGISAMSPKIFLPLMTLGHVSGSLALAYVGNGIISTTEPMFIILSLITLLGGAWFIWRLRKIRQIQKLP